MKEHKTRDSKASATLIYDSRCPICTGSVRWIREHEVSGSFTMVQCQSEERRSLHAAVNRAECMNAMHLVLPDGSVLVGEQAMPYILSRIRGFRFAAPLFKLPGATPLSRIAYRWFAVRRYRIAAVLSHLAGKRKDAA